MNKEFISKNFILETKAAEQLYHDFAIKMPIIDYHCHINLQEIAENRQWDNLTQIWLGSDHYKWRAMRANGINEYFITGEASDWEKFRKWAETVPYTLRNPLYHWTHLELKKTFGITKLLNPVSALEIFNETSKMLASPDLSTQGILKQWKVEVICTTDDPVDSLEYHQQIKDSGISLKVLPSWRPDKAMDIENTSAYNEYLNKLEKASGISITVSKDLMQALKNRHDYFAANGCKLSDHGIEEFYTEPYTEYEVSKIFQTIRSGKNLKRIEILKFKSFMLHEFALMNHEKGWVQQIHFGPLRNNNTRLFQKIGADSGFDSMGDLNIAKSLSAFLDRLDQEDKLAKTIIYNINPKDNDMIATMIGNFQDGSVPGKIQFGSGWWFLDQKQGMEAQINSLSNHGLLSRFVGMLTDSRSLLSYSRHEYFRRILCNLLGNDIKMGLIPNDTQMLGKMVQNICYNNAKEYFNF